MDKDQHLEKLAKLSGERSGVLADLESVTADLRRAVVAAVKAGAVNEIDAHRLTGVSRSSIREWLGKKT